MERRYFTTRKEHELRVMAVWCNSIVEDIKTVGGLAATVFSMSITQSCLLSIDALSGLPFKISPELRVSLGTPDTVIAATASLHDSPLLTNNAKDYPMPELTLYKHTPEKAA